MAGIAEFFGFDGSLFKNPAEFGWVKLFAAVSHIRPGRRRGGRHRPAPAVTAAG